MKVLELEIFSQEQHTYENRMVVSSVPEVHEVDSIEKAPVM